MEMLPLSKHGPFRLCSRIEIFPNLHPRRLNRGDRLTAQTFDFRSLNFLFPSERLTVDFMSQSFWKRRITRKIYSSLSKSWSVYIQLASESISNQRTWKEPITNEMGLARITHIDKNRLCFQRDAHKAKFRRTISTIRTNDS